MIEIKALFGILSGVAVLIGGVPYIIDIHRGKARPHVLSWLGWTFITALGASAMYAEGSTWVVGILWANALNSLLIAGYSVIKKVGVWSTGVYDYIFFGLGVIGLILWQTLDMPLIALICAIVADLSFGFPTIIKAYKDPSTETSFVWAASSISGLLSLFAIQNFAFHEIAYPLYLFIYDTVVLLLVIKIIHHPIHRKFYRYTSNGEGIFSAGKRLLPENLVSEAWEARKWMPKPQLPEGDYVFFLTYQGKKQYEKTLLDVHGKYLPNIKCEEIGSSNIGAIYYEDKWQVVIKK